MFVAMLVLLFATMQTNAATAKWESTDDSVVEFGKPSAGNGPSSLTLQKRSGGKSRGYNSNGHRRLTKITYDNQVNNMRCFFTCRPTPTQYEMVRVYENGKLISKARVTVEHTRNPNGDKFKLKVLYVRKGYKWIGAGSRSVCENCTFTARLVQKAPRGTPVTTKTETPSPVPVPPALAMMFTGLFGLYGVRKLRKA